MIDLDAIKTRAADSVKPIHSGGWEIEGRCPDERGVYWLVCTDCGMEWGENERGEHVVGVLECAHPLVADVRDLIAEIERLRAGLAVIAKKGPAWTPKYARDVMAGYRP